MATIEELRDWLRGKKIEGLPDQKEWENTKKSSNFSVDLSQVKDQTKMFNWVTIDDVIPETSLPSLPEMPSFKPLELPSLPELPSFPSAEEAMKRLGIAAKAAGITVNELKETLERVSSDASIATSKANVEEFKKLVKELTKEKSKEKIDGDSRRNARMVERERSRRPPRTQKVERRNKAKDFFRRIFRRGNR